MLPQPRPWSIPSAGHIRGWQDFRLPLTPSATVGPWPRDVAELSASSTGAAAWDGSSGLPSTDSGHFDANFGHGPRRSKRPRSSVANCFVADGGARISEE